MIRSVPMARVNRKLQQTEAPTEIKKVLISVSQDSSTVSIGDSAIEVSANGKKIIAFTNGRIELKAPTAAAATPNDGTKVSISADFNTVVLNGVTTQRATGDCLVIPAT